MKKISAILVSIFMLFALTFNHAVQAEDGAYYQESQTVNQDVDTLKNRAITGQNNNANVPSEYLVQQASDVPDDYWAAMEINACIKEGIIPLNSDGTFSPESVVKRVEFAQWILNALENSTFQITVHSNYSDVNEQTPGYETILRNDQIGLVYGYTDGEFKPERIITKAETNSIMSHITKDYPVGESVLGAFTDSDTIPAWARHTYEKTVRYNLYVNHPDPYEFLPNKQLNRAEAAVLLYKLRNQLNLVKKAYKAERMLGVEHLDVTPLAPCNTVQVTDRRLIVDAGNVIKVAFTNRFNSKNYNVGDEVHFYAKKDIRTVEGTLVFPQGTKFLAAIESLEDPRWLNKNARMTISFKNATFPDGKVVDMVANAFENEGVLVSNSWEKPLLWTLGGTVVGTGIGLAVGVPKHKTGTALAIGIPTGAAAGAIIGFLTPGVNFGAAQDDEIYVLIREAFSIYTVSPDDND
ncbi:MAG: S-layer homology domain-containing protein [bacterium]|nr:S-layer homology domain-containing protein [bacterium]